jgi:precorrin-2 dehydrogenase/sirohydrochlorin ferrochelatase
MKLYPIMVNLEGMPVLVVGGGEVGFRKAADLLESGAIVTVISPQLHELFDDHVKYPALDMIKRQYRYGDMDGYHLVFCATNNREVNQQIFEEAQKKNVLINAADDPPNCSFTIPSFMRKGDLILSLSTNGASPAYAARLRRELEEIIPENIEVLLSQLRRMRGILKTHDDFKHLAFHDRGAVLKAAVKDDDVLNKIVDASEDELFEILKGFNNL